MSRTTRRRPVQPFGGPPPSSFALSKGAIMKQMATGAFRQSLFSDFAVQDVAQMATFPCFASPLYLLRLQCVSRDKMLTDALFASPPCITLLIFRHFGGPRTTHEWRQMKTFFASRLPLESCSFPRNHRKGAPTTRQQKDVAPACRDWALVRHDQRCDDRVITGAQHHERTATMGR
jgi:hypothetical protein